MAVDETSATAVSWTLTAVAIVLSAARFYARSRIVKQFQWDDLCHGFALAFLIVEVSAFTAALQIVKSIIAYEAGESMTPPNYTLFQRLLYVWLSMCWCVVWSVKFGFMILYRVLFGVSKAFTRWWWAVFAFTFLSFWAALTPTFVYCGGSSSNLLNEQLCDSDSVDQLQYNYFIFGTVLNIATDISIMFLPLAMLRRLHMTKLQRIGLFVMFSLTTVVIITECVRLGLSKTDVSDENLNFVLASLESCIAVWVSSMPSLHLLFQQAKPLSGNRATGASRSIHLQQSGRRPSTRTGSMQDESRLASANSIHGRAPVEVHDIILKDKPLE